MNRALFTALCLLPTALIAHPGSGMVHDSQHVSWLFAVLAVVFVGFLLKKKYY